MKHTGLPRVCARQSRFVQLAAGVWLAVAGLFLSSGSAVAGPLSFNAYLQQTTLSRAVIAGQPDSLGISVAIDAAGNEALVGADGYGTSSGFGAAYLYRAPWWPGLYPQKLSLDPAMNATQFGISVALSADGNVALVGSNGAAFVYQYVSGSWQGPVELRPTCGNCITAQFGTSVALSGDGKTALIGDSLHPYPAAYYNNGLGWQPYTDISGNSQIQLNSGDTGVGSVALNSDGSVGFVGLPFFKVPSYAAQGDAQEIIFYKGRAAAELPIYGDYTKSDFGSSVQIDDTGDTVAIGGSQQVMVGNPVTNHWQMLNLNGYLAVGTVALSGNGKYLLVQARKAKNSYVVPFALVGGTWQRLPAIPFSIAPSLALSDDGATAILGDPRAVEDNKPGMGEAYIYRGVVEYTVSFRAHLCKGCTLATWLAPAPLKALLAGYNVYSGKRRLNKALVTSETTNFSFRIKGAFKHVHAVPVLGIPPACLTGGPYTSRFDGSLGTGWKTDIPQAGPSFSLKAVPGCERLTVPGSNVYDSWSNADNAPELLRNASSTTSWTATTRLTLSKVGASTGSFAPPGFHTGMVVRFPSAPGQPYPTQLYWGLYQAAAPNVPLSLRLEQTGTQNLVEVPAVPRTMELRVTFDPSNCTYRFWYEYPGQTAFTDSGYSYHSCASNPQVGLMTKTFGSPIAVTTDFDWFDLHS